MKHSYESFSEFQKNNFSFFPVSTSRIPEKILQTIFLNKFSFLQEHESYGLPKLSEIHSFVEQHSDWKVIETRGTINRWAWIPIKLLSSIIHRLYKGKEAQKLFQFYGRTLEKFFPLEQVIPTLFSSKKMKNGISAYLVVYHEEKVIERCLKSLVGVVNEIIVIHDGPCLDKTMEIAKKYTNHVLKKNIKE